MPSKLSTRKDITNPRRIIAFAGSKQSGKNSAANFVAGMLLYSYSVINMFKLTHDGIIMDNELVDVNKMAPKFIQIYHWADTLKQGVSTFFGIDLKLLYGDDSAKNTLTHLLWEDMPGVITNKKMFADLNRHIKKKTELLGKEYQDNFQFIYHEPGRMSVRDVLQFFGTDICRTMYSNCWVQALEQRILREGPIVALIADTRFDNELFAAKSWGAMCVKMGRNPQRDSHSSENGIVQFSDWTTIINNEKADTIPQMHEVFTKSLAPIGAFEEL